MLVCDQVLSFASDEIIKKDVAFVLEVSQTQECPNTIKFYCGISPAVSKAITKCSDLSHYGSLQSECTYKLSLFNLNMLLYFSLPCSVFYS